MALPTINKSWQFSLNNSNTPSGSLETDFDSTFLLVKTALKGFGTLPWTISSSCNSTTTSSSDLLVTAGDIVHANVGSAHSWVVLRKPTGDQVCWDFRNPTVIDGDVVWSPSGLFTGGTTTARPTATDSITLFSNAEFFGNPGANGGQWRAHVMHTTDGYNTRVFVCLNSRVAAFWSFERPTNPSAGWAIPLMAVARSIGNSSTTSTLLDASVWLRGFGTSSIWSAVGPVTSMPLCLTGPAADESHTTILENFNAANEIDSNYPVATCGIYHNTTTGQRGRHGYVPDMFWTVALPATGDTFNGASAYQVMGDMVVYTGGTAMLIV